MSTQEIKLKAIADAIREKDGTTAPIIANDFPARIRAISSIPEGLHTITLTVDSPESGNALGGGIASDGMIVTVKAEALDGYHSVGWQEDGEKVTGDKDYTFVVDKNRTLTALFEEGPVGRLPLGYTELQYIGFAENCYINPNLKTNGLTSKWVLDLKVNSNDSKSSILYAPNYHVGYYYYYMGISAYYSEFLFHTADQASTVFSVTPPDIAVRTSLTVDFKSKKIYVGSIEKSFQYANYDVNFSTYFGNNEQPTYTKDFNLYSAQMYSNDVLTADFVPCIDPSGVLGLYDLVREAFYSNSGTGSLTAGPAV